MKPEANIALTKKNYKAYQHYLECKATNSFPDDPIVKNNARLIRKAEDIAQRNATPLPILLNLTPTKPNGR